MFIVAVLDTMYDWRGATSGAGQRRAPQYFTINPRNFTGARLYHLIGSNRLFVTNACKELCHGPKDHGIPDPIWLYSNLSKLERLRTIDLILVCGRVAQKTYLESKFKPSKARVIKIPHPAARGVWSKEYIAEIQLQIKGK